MQAHDCCHNPFRLVFWHSDGLDAGEFSEYREACAEHSWELIDAATLGPLALKSRLRDELDASFVILLTGEQPEPRRDPLLDLKLSYPVFRADDLSLYLDELGLGSRMDLRDYVASRLAFFKSKARRDGLCSIGLKAATETPATLDAKLLAVLANAEGYRLEDLLLALVSRLAPEESMESFLGPFGLEGVFWATIKDAFGFDDANPNLSKLVLRLFYSDLSYALDMGQAAKAKKKITSYLVPDTGAAFRFCQSWRNTVSARPAYIHWMRWIRSSTESLLNELLGGLDLVSLDGIRCFDANKWMLALLVNGLKAHASADELRRIAEFAQAKASQDFWLNPGESEQYAKAYAACEAGATFMLAMTTFSPDANMGAQALAKSYCDSWYRIDQAYRQYREQNEALASWDLFKNLGMLLDSAYVDRFLQVLGTAWEQALLGDRQTLDQWSILPGCSQDDFFSRHVKAPLDSGELRKVYVIVSDALRYETAMELHDQLAANSKLKLDCTAMQSMLPSITRLGMAALLPHRTLSWGAGQNLMVDGLSSQGLEGRSKILESVNGIAVDGSELVAMKREAARAFVKDKSVVYIYHDKIDAIGDKQSSEDHTFSACRDAIKEIEGIVNYVVNSLQGSRIVITADHGFIYIPGDPPESMKTTLPAAIPGTFDTKKRYIIGKQLAEYPGAIRGSLKLDEPASEIGFLVPRGMQRFHFKGGAQFFHGGIMPQETIVPVLTVRPAGEGAKSSSAVRKVELGVMSLPPTITTRQINPRIHQDEPVGSGILARTVKVGIYKDGHPVSDEPVVLFNASSSTHTDLRKTVPLHLLGDEFVGKALYRFSLTDEESGVEVYGQDLHISLMIADEF
ncbi:MAG: BREX-1 system phosphatase PglZ type A [Spirochaetota bacterium]